MEKKMERQMLDENDVKKVVGGSIIFNADYTTCGRKSNAEYRVVNYNDVYDYIVKNCTSMSEKTMIANMVAAGYLVAL